MWLGLGTPTGTVMQCSESKVWLLGCSEVVEISIYFATGLEKNLNITNKGLRVRESEQLT